MSDQGNQFRSRQDVLDAIVAARKVQQNAWEVWFAVRDSDSAQYESARVAYITANVEVNRLIEIDNQFRAL
jgi:hypothetical protein